MTLDTQPDRFDASLTQSQTGRNQKKSNHHQRKFWKVTRRLLTELLPQRSRPTPSRALARSPIDAQAGLLQPRSSRH